MFRFTIRDVLWLMVAVGLSVGWWMEHVRLSTVRSHASALRTSLRRAHWGRVEPEPYFGFGAGPVDWGLIEKPIP